MLAADMSVPAASLAPAHRPRIDPRLWIYATIDLIAAAVFAYVVARMLPNRDQTATGHLWALVLCIAGMGVGMILGLVHAYAPGRAALGRWGRRIAIGSAVALLLLGMVALMIRILISAAFLAGVYGAFGQAASSFAMVAALLLIELIGLLPAFQLNFLMRRVGRRAFGVLPPVKVIALETAA